MRELWTFFIVIITKSLLGIAETAAAAPITAPDLSVCDDVECYYLTQSACSLSGFLISLKHFNVSSSEGPGSAEFLYQLCSPPFGICSGALRPGKYCLDHRYCRNKGILHDPAARCSRGCGVDTFRGVSRFDVVFPNLATSSCLSLSTEVAGSCKPIDRNNDGTAPSVRGFSLGDTSCFEGDSTVSVATCEEIELEPGDCIEMSIYLRGYPSRISIGPTVVIDKQSTSCTSTCLAGPSCHRCPSL